MLYFWPKLCVDDSQVSTYVRLLYRSSTSMGNALYGSQNADCFDSPSSWQACIGVRIAEALMTPSRMERQKDIYPNKKTRPDNTFCKCFPTIKLHWRVCCICKTRTPSRMAYELDPKTWNVDLGLRFTNNSASDLTFNFSNKYTVVFCTLVLLCQWLPLHDETIAHWQN